MKKFTGSFTTDATKTMKKATRMICRIGNDGAIYVTDGCTAYKMAPFEYAAIVQPVACCEAGNWSIQNGEKREEDAFDLVKIFHDAVKSTADSAALERCPLTLTTSKNRTAATYYNAQKDFVALYDTLYISALCPGFTLRAASSTTVAIAYNGDEPFALVLPIRPDDKTTRAVKAYFNQNDSNSSDEVEQLRDELVRLQDKLNQAETGAAALAERVQQQTDELETLRSASDHNNTTNDETPNETQTAPANPKTAAEIIASRFTCMDGVTATIKGAHTTAPVVWLSGDTDKHADAIKAAGARWSVKKSAFYVRVA